VTRFVTNELRRLGRPEHCLDSPALRSGKIRWIISRDPVGNPDEKVAHLDDEFTIGFVHSSSFSGFDFKSQPETELAAERYEGHHLYQFDSFQVNGIKS